MIFNIIIIAILNCLVCIVANDHTKIRELKDTEKSYIESLNEKVREEYTRKILVKYHTKGIDKMRSFTNGDMIDLRVSKDYDLKAGDFVLLDLGVSIKLPDGFYAIVLPRSSTFKEYGILQVGANVIDSSYSRDEDIWMMLIYATRDIHIDKNTKICQFTIVPKQIFGIKEVQHLSDKNRGGLGSADTK